MDDDTDMVDGETVAGQSPSIATGQTRPGGVATIHPDIELGELASSGSSSDEASDMEEVEQEDYEASRQRRIAENQLLLDSLGFQLNSNASASSSSLALQVHKPPASKKRKLRTATYDRSGHIISLPNPGEKHVMAYIELPRDRKVMRRITEGEYVDCSHWAEGEERRWRIGDGKNPYQQGEEVIVGGVGPDFRWRKWLGVQRELRNELAERGELNDEDVRGTRVAAPVDQIVSDYSLIPGSSCHQCRRKSDKEKMKCRNTQPECNASFCSSCCKRYSYFEFDPDARSFICPLCRDICNCSNCIRKRDLAHLLDPNKSGTRLESLTLKVKRQGKGLTVEDYIRPQESRRLAPFDRVRLVCQDEDIISPDLPPEPVVIIPTKPKPVKSKKSTKSAGSKDQMAGPKGSSVKKKIQTRPTLNGTKSGSPLKIRFKVPAQSTKPSEPVKHKRPKEVDSDGDTVGGWSDDTDDERARSPASSLTALSDLSATPPRRLAFPPRPPGPDSDTTTTALLKVIDGAMDIGLDTLDQPGFMRPEMIHQAFQLRQAGPGEHEKSPHLVAVPELRKDNVNGFVREHGSDSAPRVNKRRKPPPASTIARAPKYMTHPHLAHSPPSSTSSSALSNNEASSSTSLPSHDTNSAYMVNQSTTLTSDAIHSSSPDPLSMPIPSYLDTLAIKQSDRRLADDIFLNNPPSYPQSPPRQERHEEDDLQSLPDNERDRDRDPLFPDTPLWYTYNHHPHQSPPTRDGVDAGRP